MAIRVNVFLKGNFATIQPALYHFNDNYLISCCKIIG